MSSTGGHTQRNACPTGGSDPRREIKPATARNAAGAAAQRWGVIAEPDGQNRHQRPADGEPQQHYTGQQMGSGRDERGGDQRHRDDQPSGHRSGDDRTDCLR
jgi:hypothetical protein